MALMYKAPIEGQKSTIDGANSDQMNTFHWLKKAIVTSRKEQYFMPLASVQNMPKHFGKTIKVYEYVPLLDIRNINDQGIDANEAVMVPGTWDAIDVDGNILAGGPYASEALALAAVGATNAIERAGNLYGSSRDVGAINGRLPVLTENGGRVNRVGFTRIDRGGSIHKFGFFFDFTQESLDFDSEDDLKDKLSTELMNGAVQLTEAVLQQDLLAAAGVVVWGGAATSHATITAEGATASMLTFRLLMRLDQALTENRTPRQTKVITGSRLIDTKTIQAGRVAFIGPDLYPVLLEMVDLHDRPAFIAVQHYADAGTVLNGEIGSVGAFRFVQVPEMLHWAGHGADVVANPGYRETNGKYDVFPVLVIGDDSFSTIGFQTDGKSVKFNIITKMPGAESANVHNDPFGELGFTSIKWYYGILVKRPERIGIIKVVAPQ